MMRKNFRFKVQILFTILTNGYAYGFLNGKIYQGTLKYACVPGLNCYSCPGAVGSCPIGALQAVLNQQNLQIPFGVLGFLFVFGSILGRFVCGWLCPFGLIQDLLLLSSIDAGNWMFHKSKINVDTLLINLYEKFEIICQKRAIALQIKMPEECFPPLFSDEDRISQIISIFLDNAISYSPEHSSILLEASIKKTIWPSAL